MPSRTSPSGWPSRDFRFHQINDSPLGTCALLVYRWTGDKEKDFLQYVAALMALSGYVEETLKELAAAIKLDEQNKKRALKDIDFENLFRDKRFKKLTR